MKIDLTSISENTPINGFDSIYNRNNNQIVNALNELDNKMSESNTSIDEKIKNIKNQYSFLYNEINKLSNIIYGLEDSDKGIIDEIVEKVYDKIVKENTPNT